MQTAPNFTVSAADAAVIGRIADRARAMDVEANGRRGAVSVLDWRMYISACHANGNPLDLEMLLAADNFNFAHDVFGIANKLDQTTGQLTNFFSPRCSRREEQEAA